jgi:threonine dehydrogenase-like Zn-dependent dehydrogenase
MKGLWLEDRRISYREDLPAPAPAEDEALIKILYAGLCSTDLEMAQGYYPFTGIPGHEFVGLVIKDPEGSGLLGKRVVGEINITCGYCLACKSGRSTHCENRSVVGILNRHGVFAELISLPVKNLHPVPDNVTDKAAVFVEPIAAALKIIQQIHLRPEHRVLVIGAGRLGQIIARVISLTGCDLEAAVRNKNAEEKLESAGIATRPVADLHPNHWDIVVEATGNPQGFQLAVKTIRPRGTIVLKSTYKGDIQAELSKIVVDEISLVGSRCGPFLPAIRLLEQGRIDPLPLISAEFELQNGLEALNKASQPGVFKILIKN